MKVGASRWAKFSHSGFLGEGNFIFASIGTLLMMELNVPDEHWCTMYRRRAVRLSLDDTISLPGVHTDGLWSSYWGNLNFIHREHTTAVTHCERRYIPGETHVDVNTSVTGASGEAGAARCAASLMKWINLKGTEGRWVSEKEGLEGNTRGANQTVWR